MGSTLVDSLVARATDGSGHPVAGATIAWSIPAGGGSVSPLTSVTDAQGLNTSVAIYNVTTGNAVDPKLFRITYDLAH